MPGMMWQDVIVLVALGLPAFWKMWQKMLIRKQDEMEEGSREARLTPVVLSELL